MSETNYFNDTGFSPQVRVTPVSLVYPKCHASMAISVGRSDPSAAARCLPPLAATLFESHDTARCSIHFDTDPGGPVFRPENRTRQHDVGEPGILAFSQAQTRCLRGFLVELCGDGAHVRERLHHFQRLRTREAAELVAVRIFERDGDEPRAVEFRLPVEQLEGTRR